VALAPSGARRLTMLTHRRMNHEGRAGVRGPSFETRRSPLLRMRSNVQTCCADEAMAAASAFALELLPNPLKNAFRITAVTAHSKMPDSSSG